MIRHVIINLQAILKNIDEINVLFLLFIIYNIVKHRYFFIDIAGIDV